MQVMSRQRGVSLIEVLVAIVIFSIGVLGIALMQIKGAQYTKQSGARTVAVLQARSIADAMRANPAGVYGVPNVNAIPGTNGVLTNSYYIYDGSTAPSCTINPACIQATTDLTLWLAQLKAGTASSGATVLTTIKPNTTIGTLTVSVSWNGMIPNTGGATTNDTYQFDFQPQPYQP